MSSESLDKILVSTPQELAELYPPIDKPKRITVLTEEGQKEVEERERAIQEIVLAVIRSVETVLKSKDPARVAVKYRSHGKIGKGITYFIKVPAPSITVEIRHNLPKGLIKSIETAYLEAGWDKVSIKHRYRKDWEVRLVDSETKLG